MLPPPPFGPHHPPGRFELLHLWLSAPSLLRAVLHAGQKPREPAPARVLPARAAPAGPRRRALPPHAPPRAPSHLHRQLPGLEGRRPPRLAAAGLARRLGLPRAGGARVERFPCSVPCLLCCWPAAWSSSPGAALCWPRAASAGGPSTSGWPCDPAGAAADGAAHSLQEPHQLGHVEPGGWAGLGPFRGPIKGGNAEGGEREWGRRMHSWVLGAPASCSALCPWQCEHVEHTAACPKAGPAAEPRSRCRPPPCSRRGRRAARALPRAPRSSTSAAPRPTCEPGCGAAALVFAMRAQPP